MPMFGRKEKLEEFDLITSFNNDGDSNMRTVLLEDEIVLKDLLMSSEMLLQVTATKYFTHFKPKREVFRV